MNNQRKKKKSSPKGRDFWGPPLWCITHIFAISLRPGTEKEYVEFLWLLTKLLPCPFCKTNLEKKLIKYPPANYLGDKVKAFWYSYMLHDLANQHISKYHPESPKSSPSFDDAKDAYTKALAYHGNEFCGNAVWSSIHILAATLKPENAANYKRMLELLTVLLPEQKCRTSLEKFLKQYPIDPHLRNNHDAFFYSFILHKTINESIRKQSPSYEVVKNFYFSSLGEECDDCNV